MRYESVGGGAELSGAVLHELKQPLTSILLNAQSAAALLDADGPVTAVAELREIIDEIICADRRASLVMARVTGLLRNEPLAAEPLRPSDLIDDVLAITHGDIELHAIATECRVDASTAPVFGDRVQLQQVLINLVVNACEAMEARLVSERCLTIRAAAEDGGYCRLSVSDTGSGIALRPANSVFEPFVTSKTNGLGLGLAICRKIVAAHGGKIWAENNDAGGASFHVRLPACLPSSAGADGDPPHTSRHASMLHKVLAARAANQRLRDEHVAILVRVQRDRDARLGRRRAMAARHYSGPARQPLAFEDHAPGGVTYGV